MSEPPALVDADEGDEFDEGEWEDDPELQAELASALSNQQHINVPDDDDGPPELVSDEHLALNRQQQESFNRQQQQESILFGNLLSIYQPQQDDDDDGPPELVSDEQHAHGQQAHLLAPVAHNRQLPEAIVLGRSNYQPQQDEVAALETQASSESKAALESVRPEGKQREQKHPEQKETMSSFLRGLQNQYPHIFDFDEQAKAPSELDYLQYDTALQIQQFEAARRALRERYQASQDVDERIRILDQIDYRSDRSIDEEKAWQLARSIAHASTPAPYGYDLVDPEEETKTTETKTREVKSDPAALQQAHIQQARNNNMNQHNNQSSNPYRRGPQLPSYAQTDFDLSDVSTESLLSAFNDGFALEEIRDELARRVAAMQATVAELKSSAYGGGLETKGDSKRQQQQPLAARAAEDIVRRQEELLTKIRIMRPMGASVGQQGPRALAEERPDNEMRRELTMVPFQPSTRRSDQAPNAAFISTFPRQNDLPTYEAGVRSEEEAMERVGARQHMLVSRNRQLQPTINGISLFEDGNVPFGFQQGTNAQPALSRRPIDFERTRPRFNPFAR
jgi:hypothetical protein